jgi:hypothetical protein
MLRTNPLTALPCWGCQVVPTHAAAAAASRGPGVKKLKTQQQQRKKACVDSGVKLFSSCLRLKKESRKALVI